MSATIPESDWRHFKKIRDVLVDRHFQQTLDLVRSSLDTKDGTVRDQYSRVFKLVKERDKEVARLFDDFRRSTAIFQAALIWKIGLMKDDEWNGFSEPTRKMIRALCEPI